MKVKIYRFVEFDTMTWQRNVYIFNAFNGTRSAIEVEIKSDKKGKMSTWAEIIFSNVSWSHSSSSFFENMSRIITPNYIPTETDLLRVRVRTCGIIETQFQVNGTIFR